MAINILGININHDTSAAILVDGKIVAAVEEERFNRERHTHAFPEKSIDYCLKAASLEMNDVDYIVTSFHFHKFAINFQPLEENTIAGDDLHLSGRFKILWDNLQLYLRARGILRKHIKSKVICVEHHMTHACTAYYFNNFSETNILTIDGRGEIGATHLYHGNNNAISLLESYDVNDSLGHLYSYATYLCGFSTGTGQGKTMGLAPYGGPGIDWAEKVVLGKHRYHINWKKMREWSRYGTVPGKLTDDSRNIAWAAQDALNQTIILLARKLYEKTGSRNFALAGGVALNATANGQLLKEDFVDNLFVFPAANDAGTPIGAAMHVMRQHQVFSPQKQELVYLGPDYSNEEIEQTLKQSKLKYEYYDDIEDVAADLLADGNIVGWFQGRMEFGPRALGNRSILADPRSKDTKDKINHWVKHREPWRPFAPAILYECMKDYFYIQCAAPYMIINFDVREEKRSEIPSAVHVDGTARVQTVTQEDNQRFYKLLQCFAKRTGIPVLLNTSLNTRSEPIVCSPQDAIMTFYSTGLDALCLGNFLLRKAQ